MTTETAHREFVPGTTGWSVEDLDDPEIERLWCQGRYEIVEGVLTQMAPALFDGSAALQALLFLTRTYLEQFQPGWLIANEVDLILSERRLPVVDAIFLSPEDQLKQKQAHTATGKRKNLKYGRILVSPTLVIESVSQGHEAHDRETKRGWYAEAKIPNYWMLDAQQRSLECLVLDVAEYRVDQSGREDAQLKPGMFPGLVIELGKLWAK
ncbi:MAG TPA: Uma2 family endonuclease [Tepidisphaeraceae bacterium]|jgi:Uma2 family endonuclease|nr:Uma2 family endonuclease [Tepidisphaeraceae bacterium]